MGERRDNTTTGTTPSGDGQPEWDVFVRADTNGPLQHFGSVSASTPETAYEHAMTLFVDSHTDIWVCESSDVHRFSTYSIEKRIDSEVGDAV